MSNNNATRVKLISTSPTIEKKHIEDNLFKSFMKEKLKNKLMVLGNDIEVVIFGKKCDFKVMEVIGNQLKSTNSDGFLMKDNTELIMELEGQEKSEEIEEKKVENYDEEICEEIHRSELSELAQIINFNCDDVINDGFKLKNIAIAGREQTGKKTLVKRLEKKFLGKISFDRKKFKIEKKNDSNLERNLKLFIKESKLDVLVLEFKSSQNSQSNRSESNNTSVDDLIELIINIGDNRTKIFLLDEDMLDQTQNFDRIIRIKNLTQKDRLIFLRFLLKKYPNKLEDEQITDLSLRTSGFTINDLQRLCKSAYFHSYCFQKMEKLNIEESKMDGEEIKENGEEKEKFLITYEKLKAEILQIKPINISQIQTSIPPTPWSSIGGYSDIKSLIQLTIELPLKNPDLYKKKGLNVPKGILFYGPPGCSKTLMARALASESYFNFISIKGPEIFSKYVGDSEKAIRDVFMKARVNSPCIVFFDEIDGIGGKRTGSGNSSGVGDRVLIQLLTEIDGFDGLDDVIVIGATNRPEVLDDALMRPGRLDEIVYIGLPDAEARKEILVIQMKNMNFEEGIKVEEFVEKTDGYTGAEIVQICKKAGFMSIQRDVDDEFIRQEDLDKAALAIKPRISPQMVLQYKEFQQKRGGKL